MITSFVGTRMSGKSTDIFIRATNTSRYKMVWVVAPRLKMSEVMIESYMDFLRRHNIHFKANVDSRRVTIKGFNYSVIFMSWEESIKEENQRSVSDVRVYIDEAQEVLASYFNSPNVTLNHIAINKEGL